MKVLRLIKKWQAKQLLGNHINNIFQALTETEIVETIFLGNVFTLKV